MAVAAGKAKRLSQENDDRENGYGQHQYQPLEIVTLEPAGKMQDQNNRCNCVEDVERHFFPVTGLPSTQADIDPWLIIHDFLEKKHILSATVTIFFHFN